jgi:hypothetical protein
VRFPHLRVDPHVHRRLPVDSELCQAIAVLARAHQATTVCVLTISFHPFHCNWF